MHTITHKYNDTVPSLEEHEFNRTLYEDTEIEEMDAELQAFINMTAWDVLLFDIRQVVKTQSSLNIHIDRDIHCPKLLNRDSRDELMCNIRKAVGKSLLRTIHPDNDFYFRQFHNMSLLDHMMVEILHAVRRDAVGPPRWLKRNWW